MQNGLLISRLRTKNNLSVKDMANYLGIGITPYKCFEANQRPMSIKELNTLSNYFKVSLNALLGLSNNLDAPNSFDIDYKYLKFSLKYLRKINKFTQKDLAKALNVTAYTISHYEKYPEEVKADYLRAFALKFHISVDYICGKSLEKKVL